MSNEPHKSHWWVLEQTFRNIPVQSVVRFLRVDSLASPTFYAGTYQKTARGQYRYVSGARIFAPELTDTEQNNTLWADEVANVIADRPNSFAYMILPINPENLPQI